jgi:hypothetical protein
VGGEEAKSSTTLQCCVVLLCYAQTELFGVGSEIAVWAGHVARMGEKRNAYRLLVGKPEGKRPLGRPRRR